jgi:chorismate mutase
MSIADLRKRIDELDAKLVELLNERATCACQIGVLKRGEQMPIYEPQREQLIFDQVRKANRGPLSNSDLAQVYERIIDIMRKIQREQISVPRPPQHATELDEND